jgi:hypothetical protein
MIILLADVLGPRRTENVLASSQTTMGRFLRSL